ncbi:hypothetical protein B0H12DRAFT_1242285 [Mycena haematopus]|nr:hypothetical protein B0H12DRAFT_1242285 [Mycena haematopus]
MSETPSPSKNSGLALSVATPFLLSLTTQSSDPAGRPDIGDGPVSHPAPRNKSPATLDTLHHVHEQKGLSSAQVAGLKGVQSTLSSNNGGIPSGTPGQSAIPDGAKRVLGDGNGPPLGPASNTRRITRSSTLPDMAPVAPASADDPVTVSSVPVDPDHPTNTVPRTAVDVDLPSSSNVTMFAHFGLNPGAKSEISSSTIKRTTKNLGILANVTRTTETQVNKLALDLDKLTVEVRLNTAPFSLHDHVSRSPTPTRSRSVSRALSAPQDDGSMRDDIDELFDRVMDLERFESAASSGAAVFSTRVSALEDRTPAAGGQITTALTAALASRFQDITSDRDKLNNEIRFQAEKHAHEIRSQAEKQAQVTAKLQRAQDELLKTLSGLQVTIARLELSIPAPPLRLPARLSDTEQRHVLSAPSKYPRPRSPAPRAHSPAPRARSPAPRGRSPVPRIRSPPPRSRS